MNSHIPMIHSSLATSRMNEHLAEAEKARAMRALPQRKNTVTVLRSLVANLLVRIGQRMSPAAPQPEQGGEHVLIRLAR